MDVPSRTSVTRRASLVALGAAGLGVTLSPVATSAKKNKRKVTKRCKPQVAQCEVSMTTLCANVGIPDCAALVQCCAPLAGCNFNSFATCLADVL